MAKSNKTVTANSGAENGKKQTFSLTAPMATSVQLVGDFTQWQQKPINMHKGPDGSWRTTVELPPGAHHYRFLVNGEWQNDPECPLQTPNPFGGNDSVREVN